MIKIVSKRLVKLMVQVNCMRQTALNGLLGGWQIVCGCYSNMVPVNVLAHPKLIAICVRGSPGSVWWLDNHGS